MIDPNVIEEIRRRVPLSRVIGERIKLERRGRSFVGLCPFHKEKTPSFHVNDERGFYHCFGCSVSGDVISFLKETEGLGFVEAVEQLAQRAGVEIVDNRSDAERKNALAQKRRRDEVYEVGEMAARFFEQSLDAHPLGHVARAELVRRGLDREFGGEEVSRALADFRIGYAPYAWDALSRHLREAGASLTVAERVGLVAPRKSGGGYYDRFRHRLMFAVTDLRGRVIAFSGRALPNPEDQELQELGVPSLGSGQSEAAKYINSPESTVYKKRETVFGLYQARDAIQNGDRAVIVEGNFDVVSLHARGIRNVVAPLGTAFTAEQAKEIKRYTNQVTLLFDGDKAGARAARAARTPCQEEGLTARVAVLPEGSDPDDLARHEGAEGVTRRIAGARGMLEYLIECALDTGFSAHDAQTRANKIKEVTDLIASETDPTVRALAERHADWVAARLGIGDARTFRALKQAVQGAARPAGLAGPRVAPPERARSRGRPSDIAKEVLGALLEYPSLLDHPDVVPRLERLEGPLALALSSWRRASAENLPPTEAVERFPEAYRDFVSRRLAAPTLDDEAIALGVLSSNLERLLRLYEKKQRRHAVEDLVNASQAGDQEAEMRLLRESVARARKKHKL